MKFKETELLPYNPEIQDLEECTDIIELSPCEIIGIRYNIPSKLHNKVSMLSQIHMYYRSDNYKVIFTHELNDYPRRLEESTGECYGYSNRDQLCIPLEFSVTGKEDVRISLYKVGEANPLGIDRFKPGVYGGNNIVFGYDFVLKNGDYFLLFDNIEVNLEEFSKYESLIDINGKKELFKWYGSESFRKPFYLENKMFIIPFHIYK